VQFTAKVVGVGNQSVSWSVREGNGGGIINSSGLYTAPNAAGTFHVVATSQGDPKASGTASVQVPELTVSIFPPAETLRIGGQRQFGGFALAANQNVTWKLQEGAAGGNITARGLYTAPGTIGTFHVIATSIANPNVSATAPVTILNVGFAPIEGMAIPRVGHTVTLLQDGRVLVAGGTRDTTHSAEFFAPASNGFTVTSGAMIHVRSGHCAALLQDGRVLIAGGDDGNGTLFTDAELFDPATQSFVAASDLNQGRTGASVTSLPNGMVLIAGGQDAAGTLLGSAELYDPVTGNFTLSGNMNVPRSQHTATLLSNGKVLLVGSSGDTSSAELFDPVTGRFEATGSLSQSRSHHTATLLPSGKVLVLGGTQMMMPVGGGASSAPVSLNSAEIYDPAKGTFQTAGQLLIARDSHSATLLTNGTVLVSGGYVHGFDGDADPTWNTIFGAELFDPATSTSTTAASLNADRAEHTATLLNNGQVLITGGISGYLELCCNPKPHIVTLSSAELYR
jgi:hypothetical protein